MSEFFINNIRVYYSNLVLSGNTCATFNAENHLILNGVSRSSFWQKAEITGHVMNMFANRIEHLVGYERVMKECIGDKTQYVIDISDLCDPLSVTGLILNAPGEDNLFIITCTDYTLIIEASDNTSLPLNIQQVLCDASPDLYSNITKSLFERGLLENADINTLDVLIKQQHDGPVLTNCQKFVDDIGASYEKLLTLMNSIVNWKNPLISSVLNRMFVLKDKNTVCHDVFQELDINTNIRAQWSLYTKSSIEVLNTFLERDFTEETWETHYDKVMNAIDDDSQQKYLDGFEQFVNITFVENNEFAKIWQSYGYINDGTLPLKIKDAVNIATSKGESNLVCKELKPFIGRFECEHSVPEWWHLFEDKCLNAVLGNKLEQQIKIALSNMKNNSSLLQKGVCSEKPNAQKFGRLLQKALKTDPSSMDWFKPFNDLRTTANITLVGTKDPVSVMGMSSLSDGLWTSCQNLSEHSHTHANGLWSEILNRTNMVLYITDGQETTFDGIKEIKRERMLSRVILRQVNTKNGPGVMLDRFYPNAKHSTQVINIVRSICAQNGLQFYCATDLNTTQESSYAIQYVYSDYCVGKSRKYTGLQYNGYIRGCCATKNIIHPFLDTVRICVSNNDQCRTSVVVGVYIDHKVSF